MELEAIEKVAYASIKILILLFVIIIHRSKYSRNVSVLNPKKSDCKYPYKELSGCGVGFKLIQAICKIKK